MKKEITIEVKTVKSNEKMSFDNYDSFIYMYRFFLSSGLKRNDECKFEEMIETLDKMDFIGSMEICRSGLMIKFTRDYVN